ncbi:membrane protein insertion efficiency factor YidD [Candidatus Microgenomates bacterium]|nr:MAG: membrane protein insertion efficiency factor YidD [Candidatus Microgenomates bacterium]
MKLLFIFIIGFYQKIISPIIKNILGTNKFCRFSPSCSDYAKKAISTHGIIKGGRMSITRLLHCQPFYNQK